MVIEPIAPRPEPLRATQPMFDTYALGWDVQDYRGARLIWHGGAVFGSLAAVAMLPDRNVGIYIAVNSEEGEVVRGLMYELLDHYLGLPRDTWPEKLHAFREQQDRGGDRGPARAGGRSRRRSAPRCRWRAMPAIISDPWYGTINVREENGHLNVAFPHTPGLRATLEHWQYDTFVTRFNDPVMEPAYMTFQLDAQGHVDRITMRVVSPIADFSFDYQDLLFTPVAAAGRGGTAMIRSAAFLAACLLSTMAFAQPPGAIDQRVERVLRETPIIDGHNDLPWELRTNYGAAGPGPGCGHVAWARIRCETDMPAAARGPCRRAILVGLDPDHA